MDLPLGDGARLHGPGGDHDGLAFVAPDPLLAPDRPPYARHALGVWEVRSSGSLPAGLAIAIPDPAPGRTWTMTRRSGEAWVNFAFTRTGANAIIVTVDAPGCYAAWLVADGSADDPEAPLSPARGNGIECTQ